MYTDDVDSNFSTSTSPGLTHTVDADTTKTVVSQPITNVTTTGGQSNSSFNPTVTFTATVTSGHGGTPTGTVQFLANGTDIGTPQTVVSNGVSGEGQATFTDSTLTASSGPQTITAQYVNSDGNFQGSSDTTGVVLGQVETNGSAEITNSTLSLTQGKNGQAASGFFNVKQNIANFSTNFSFQLTSAMADGFTFTIQGDPRGASAVGPGGGGLGYGPDNNTKTDSRDITNSVAVKFDIFNNQGEGNDSTGLFQNGAAPTVTGSIDLSSSGLKLNSGDVIDVAMTYNGTTLTETLTDTATGVSAPTQSYTVNIPTIVGGNTAFVGFTGATGDESAIQDILSWTFTSRAGTTTTVDSSPNPSVFGQAVTFTVTVAPTSGTGTPTGTVNFVEGSTTLASSVSLNSSGEATFSTSSLATGSNTITANYSGDTTFQNSTGSDSASPQVVNQASTTTTLGSAPNPSVSGQTVTFTATVAPATPGAGAPTGTVSFLEGSTTLASSVTLNGSDQATFTTSSLTVGSHTITADYNGDTNFLASSGNDSASPQVVNHASTTTTVNSAPNPSVSGQTVTFTATVAATSGTGTPTGTVNFLEGSTTLASGVSLSGSGQATFSTTSLTVGSHTITANYSGDTSFLTSTGNDSTSPQVVNQASTTTTLASAANPSVSGQTVTFTATVVCHDSWDRHANRNGELPGGKHHLGVRRDPEWVRSGHVYDFLSSGGQPHGHGQLQRRHEFPDVYGKRFGFAAGRQPVIYYYDACLRRQSVRFGPDGDVHGHRGLPRLPAQAHQRER